jgi:hypothetical protein
MLNNSTYTLLNDASTKETFASWNLLAMLRFIVSFVTTALLSVASPTSSDGHAVCKAHPGSSKWPTQAEWSALNRTLNGRLLKPLPLAAVCHPDLPMYNKMECQATNWTIAETYANDPVGIICPNWAWDTCLPSPKYSCTAEGYPIYVVSKSLTLLSICVLVSDSD